MSGVDEQDRFPRCPSCGELFYWVVRVHNDNYEQSVIAAYVNTEVAVNEGRAKAVVELEDGWCDVALVGIQTSLCSVECGSCSEKATDSERKKLVSELEKHWDMRECL